MSALHLFRGADPALLGAAVLETVHALVGTGDRSLMVEDLDGDTYDVAAVIDAVQTPPFLTDRRVVVARGIQRFDADALGGLAALLGDRLPTTDLVLVAESERLPKKFVDALKQAGGVVHDTDVGTRRADRDGFVRERVEAAGLRLDRGALDTVAGRLGEDLGRLDAVLETLVAAFGPSARLGTAEVAPFLGEAGPVPPWELTDAIDRGDSTTALDLLHRMLHAGGRHPLQVMAVLHGHYARMLRLDGLGPLDEHAAAGVLGLKGSAFPARKALDRLRALGHDGLVRAIELLARADLDLRGARDLPETLVLEVLVARLSRLTGPKTATARRHP